MSETNETTEADDLAHRTAVDEMADWTEEDGFDADEPPPGTRATPTAIMLTDLADVLRGAGLTVRELDGWKQRVNNSGYERLPVAIIVHHTASSTRTNPENEANLLAQHPKAKPLCNLYLDRTGTWWIIAAGATNTNGYGGALGPLKQDRANRRVIGIEAANNGVGEPWPDAQQDSYVRGVAALADHYGIDTTAVFSHHEWAPNRKIDPAGPSRFGSINRAGTWDMNLFRAAVNAARHTAQQVHKVDLPAPVQTVDTYVVQAGESWWAIATKTMGDPGATWREIAAANGGEGRVLRTGDVLTIPGRTPSGATPAAAPSASVGFPGVASVGNTGDVVLAWQVALIAKGVIADNASNHDAAFGPGMEKAVRTLQASWGWADATGIADQRTWDRLHGH